MATSIDFYQPLHLIDNQGFQELTHLPKTNTAVGELRLFQANKAHAISPVPRRITKHKIGKH